MSNLEITIQRKTDSGWFVVANKVRQDGSLPVRKEAMLALDPALVAAMPTPLAYGIELGKGLFRGSIHAAFTSALSDAAGEDGRLRVLLTVEDTALRELHWERLCAPFDEFPVNQGWDFLSTNQRTPFSFYLPSQADRRFPIIGRRDLKALVLVAGPEDLAQPYRIAPFPVDQTVAQIQAALAQAQIPCDILASVAHAAAPPTLNELVNHLTTGGYTLLHIVCHGVYNPRDGDTQLYLPGDNGLSVSASALIQRLARLPGGGRLPYFVFLMTCESASPQAESGFGGLAQRMVRELGIPSVLAMTGPVSIPTANQLAKDFYSKLRQHGELDRALGEAIAPQLGSPDALIPAILSRLGARPLFSDSLERPLDSLSAAEIDFGLQRMEALLAERAPVLLKEFLPLARSLQPLAGVERDPLNPSLWDDRSAALRKVNEICGAALEVSFNALALDRPVGLYNPRCPFPGLFPFQPQDREFFFGREKLVAELCARLEQHPFLALLGSSGSGKSSLVLAGMVPLLLDPAPAGPPLGYLTPGDDPPLRLQEALARLEEHPGPGLLIVDQFEELFTLCKDELKRQAFVRLLLEAAGRQRVILTMRSDFWGAEFQPYPELKKAIQAHQELIFSLDPEELRSATEQQARAVGLDFEGGLAGRILDDVMAEPGSMPLLQHALFLLWERRHGRWLRDVEYSAYGGVQKAIATSANQMYRSLPDARRMLMRDIFIRLTRTDEQTGLQHRDTRQRVRIEQLVSNRASIETVRDLVDYLANRRLVVTTTRMAGEQRIIEVEVAHEALLSAWDELRMWLDHDRDEIRLRAQVSRAAQEWAAHQFDENYLDHREKRLEQALTLLKSTNLPLNPEELTYLEACQRSERERTSLEVEVVASFENAARVLLLHLRPRHANSPDDTHNGSPYTIRDRGYPYLAGRQVETRLASQFRLDQQSLAQARGDPLEYGRRLSEILFSIPAVSAAYAEALSAGQGLPNPLSHLGLHLSILIDENFPELNAIEWETLHDPGSRQPYYRTDGLYLSRMLPMVSSPLRSRRKLRALAILSPDPVDLEQGKYRLADLQAEQTRVESALNGIPATFLAAHEDLQRVFSELAKPYDILYLLGPTCAMENEIIFWNFGEGIQVRSEQLREFIWKGARSPRLVVVESTATLPVYPQGSGARADLLAGLHQLAAIAPNAVYFLPQEMPAEKRSQALETFFQVWYEQGVAAYAASAARYRLDPDPAAYLPALFTNGLGAPAWATEGFAEDGPAARLGTNLYQSLTHSIEQGRLLPVLGPGVSEPVFPSQRAIAWQLAQAAQYPLDSPYQAQLAQVARYITIRQGEEEFFKRYKQVLWETFGLPIGEGSSSARQGAASIPGPGALQRALARLSLPVYLTTTTDSLLEEALLAQGKQPQTILCPWNNRLSGKIPLPDRLSGKPEPSKPWVYHLFGHGDEPDSLLFTDEDYFAFMRGVTAGSDVLPGPVRRAMSNASLLFLGFDPDGLDLQTVFQVLSQGQGFPRPAASQFIQLDPPADPQTRQYLVSRMAQLESQVYWGSPGDLLAELYPQTAEEDGL